MLIGVEEPCSYQVQMIFISRLIYHRPDSGDVIGQAHKIVTKLKENGYSNFGIILGDSITFDQAKEWPGKY
jgi:nicotinic acid phosphoribosyltransferase